MSYLIHFNKDLSGYGAQQISMTLLRSSSLSNKIYISLSGHSSSHEEFERLLASSGCKVLYLSALTSVFYILRLSYSRHKIIVHGHSSKSILPLLALSVVRFAIPELKLVFTNHGYLRSNRLISIIQWACFFLLNLLRCKVITVESPNPSSLLSVSSFILQEYIPNPLPFESSPSESLLVYRSFLRDRLCDTTTINLGIYGSLNQQKNPLFAVEIIEHLLSLPPDPRLFGRNFRLSIIGDGPLASALHSQLDLISSTFKCFAFNFYGYVTGSELDALLHEIDIALFPSLYDSYNIALRHAVSRDVLCLSSNNVPWPPPTYVYTKPYSNNSGIPQVTNLRLDPFLWAQSIFQLLTLDGADRSLIKQSASKALLFELHSSRQSLQRYNEIYANFTP